MIIFEQTKEIILNFDNVSAITVDSAVDGKNIVAVCNNGDGAKIGTYETSERAKEVLQEIIKSYREYKTAECDGYTNVLEETAVFEMPQK